MRNRSFALILMLVSILLCMSGGDVSASSGKKNSKPKSIPIPENVKKSQEFFGNIPPRIMSLMEDGSPRALKQAASLLHRNSEESYTEKEKILLFLAQGMMQVAWPSYTASWSVPEFSRTDAYTNMLYGAVNGVFDVRIRNEDFLSLILPSLVILTAPSSDSYYDKAESALRKALVMRSSSTLANYLMGVLMYRRGESRTAVPYFQKALESDGSNKEILTYGLKAGNASSDFALTESLGERLLALDPQNEEALRLVCDAYYAGGNLDKAGEYAARVLMVAPDSFEYVLMRAKIAMAGGDYVRTASLLDAYSRSGNVCKDYYLLRARLQKEWNKNSNSAAETVGNALVSYPDDTDILLYAAVIASDANMKIAGCSALELARKVLKSDSGNGEAVRICVSELNKAGEYSKAYDLSSTVVNKDSATMDDLCRHIDICISCRRYDEASRLARRLYAEDGSVLDVQKALVKVLVAQEKTSEAEKMINSLMASSDSEMKSFLYYEKSFLYGDEASTLENLRASLTQNPRNSQSLYRLYQVYYNKKDWRRAQYYLRQVVALNPVDSNALAKNEELNTLLKR